MTEKNFDTTPGRTLADMPKNAPLPIPSGAAKKPNFRQNFRGLLTENGIKDYLVVFLKEMASKKSKGPWKQHFAFFVDNQSGDVDSMKPEVRKKVDKLIKDVNEEYANQQDLF